MKKLHSLLSALCLLSWQGASAFEPNNLNGSPVSMPESYSHFFPAAHKDGSKVKKGLARQYESSTEIDSPVYGYLYFSSNKQLESGFYHIDPATSSASLEWIDDYTDWGMVMTNGWMRNGLVCGLNSFTFMGGILSYNYVELDFTTGKVEKLVPLTVNNNDLRNVYVTAAYRQMDDCVYGYGYSNDGESMGFNSAPATDIDSSVTLKITDIDDVCTSLCYNPQDDLFYGVTTDGRFVSVDKNGDQNTIFTINIPNLRDAVTGIVYNPSDKTYIWNAYFNDNSSAFYKIDPQSKTTSQLSKCNSGEEYIFMVSTETAAPTAPALTVINSIDFTAGSTSGTVSATLPNKCQNGTALSSQLNWKLLIDGESNATGTGAAGSKINVSVSNLQPGLHFFAILTEANGFASEPAIQSKWIGNDNPSVPQNVKMTTTNVTWDAVTTGAHDGYVDSSNMKYVVYINGAKSGETTGTSLNITLPQGQPYQTYHADVEAICNDLKSEYGTSNYVNYGEPLKIDPSIHYRPEEYELPLFTIVNADGLTDSEGNDLTWHYGETMGFPSFISSYDGDDWLFFPPMLFDNTDNAYQFVMEAGLVSDTDTRGEISVFIGKEPKPEAMTQTILAPHRCEHMRGDDILEYFAVSEPGVYYIGIRSVTYNVAFHVSDMDIAITNRSALVTVSPSELTVQADANGNLQATVEFTMPTMTSNGKAIGEDDNLQAIISSYPRTAGTGELGELTDKITISGKPGSKQSVKIKTAQNSNLISVACALNGNIGASATEIVYTGVVRPYIVQNLSAKVSPDNMGMKLTWDPPVESGDDDGPIGTDFYYTVWYYDNGWEFGDHVGWNITDYTYTLPAGAEQQWIRLGIMALNAAGQSDYITSVTEVIGTPYNLPIIETFPDYYEEYEPIMVLRPTSQYENTYWYVDDPADLLGPAFANESHVAYIGFVDSEGPEILNAKSRLSLPKFSTKNQTDVTFSLDYFGGINGAYAAQFQILADAYDIEPSVIATLPKGDGWITNSVVLPETFNNLDWVEILIDNEYETNQQFALFSGYSISSPTGVLNIPDELNGRIYSEGGMIHVVGHKGEALVICDLKGNVIVSRESLDDINGFTLPKGIYIVRAGNKTEKIIL